VQNDYIEVNHLILFSKKGGGLRMEEHEAEGEERREQIPMGGTGGSRAR